MALETFATKASEELLLMMMRTTLPQYALSNVYFFFSRKPIHRPAGRQSS